MSNRILVAAFGLMASFGPIQAQTPCAMTYETFEFAVPHLDMEACPAPLARQGTFCRASVGNDAVHVFAFSEDGDRCLLATKSFQPGQFQLIVR